MPLDTRQITPFGPQPTLLDRIREDTVSRALISKTTREEDVAQRTQAAYRMLEGIEEEAPTGGYGALFGQRASGSSFRTQEDAAAFLRATDPQGMSTRQQAVGEFMANQALPRLGSVTDPAQRLAALKEMAASGPPMLNGIVSKIAADGVITDEEMAQAVEMYGSYRKPDVVLNTTQGVYSQRAGGIVPGTGKTTPDVPSSAAGLDWAYRNRGNPAADAIIAKDEADRARIGRANRPTAGGAGRAPSEWEVKRDIRNNPERYSAADQNWAAGGGTDSDGTYSTDSARDREAAARVFNDENASEADKLAAAAILGTSATGGTIAERFTGRVIQGANLATAAIENVVELPFTADTGVFGSGTAPDGLSIFDASGQYLRNEMSSDNVQAYNTMMAGVLRNLAIIESSGLAPTGKFTDSMGAVLFRPGDSTTGLTRMRKMAEMRQIVDEGLRPLLAGRASKEQKQFIRGIIDRIHRAVPITHANITAYQRAQAKNPKLSYRDWAKSVAPPPTDAPRLDMTNPFSVPLGTPAAPLNVRPAAPAPGRQGPVNIGRGISIERIE